LILIDLNCSCCKSVISDNVLVV